MSEVPRPNHSARCSICGERIDSEHYLGGRIKPRGTVYVHTRCWEAEQTQRAKEAKKK